MKPSLRSKQIAIKNERVLETSFSAAIIRIDFTNVLAALSYYDSNDDAWQLKIEKVPK